MNCVYFLCVMCTQVLTILDSVLSGERSVCEPTIAVFLAHLKQYGLSYYSTAGTDHLILDKYHTITKDLEWRTTEDR